MIILGGIPLDALWAGEGSPLHRRTLNDSTERELRSDLCHDLLASRATTPPTDVGTGALLADSP